jgi:hypothetical protein
MGEKLIWAPDLETAGRCNIYAIGHFSGPGIWMDDALGHEITQLLQAWRRGDEGALDKLTPQVYRELQLAARRCMGRERDGHTLQTTALINELYLRLSDLKLIDWQNRAHFFALCPDKCGVFSLTRPVPGDPTNAAMVQTQFHWTMLWQSLQNPPLIWSL